MDIKDLEDVGSNVESAEGLLASHFAAAMQVDTSASVHSWRGQNQELKIHTCDLSSSSRSFESDLNKDMSTTTAQSTELPTIEGTTSGVVIEPIYSGSAPEYLWSELLPAKEEDPSGAETSVNKEDEERYFPLVRPIHPSELEIVKEIAQGGQAKVFLAKYLKTQQNVVVKTYTCRVNPGELRRQMERVMKACEEKSYSGLCPVIGVSADDKGKVSVVMQLMEGDLRNFINNHRDYERVTYRDQLEIMRAIANGMKQLHECGLIHKDLKASNILVSPLLQRGWRTPLKRPLRKLDPITPLEGPLLTLVQRRLLTSNPVMSGMDFIDLNRMVQLNPKQVSSVFSGSIVKPNVAAALKQSLVTASSMQWVFDIKVGDYESSDGVVGTGFWRAPEVLKALRDGTEVEYSAAVDVYGFGMVCYELLSSQIPFQGHRLSDYNLVLSGRRPELPHNVTPTIKELLHRCWHMDPNQRPDWDEIQNILELEKGSC
jgi:serine/threonine protein kinase